MTEYDWKEACELRDKLEEYAEMEGTEYGEMVESLCRLSGYPDYMNQILWNAVIEAMKAELKNFEENAEVVEHTESFVQRYTELEWKN